tara:strand:- start:748 stop:897 length:150 start_codon:yes stop_codon:yes gene_type:complete
VKGFLRRLVFILKGEDPWLDHNETIKTEKETKDSIIFIDPDPYSYLDEK